MFDPDDKIDILKMSTTEIYQRLFHKATGGKIHQFGVEAPVPSCINPLTEEEIMTWDTAPMEVKRVRVARIATRRGTRPHTVSSRYAVRSSASEFTGYVSDKPVTKLFKESEPVGAVAGAIKAAGELAAAAEKNGEDSTKVWKAVEKAWGINTDRVKQYMTPDTSKSSLKDMVKLVRQSSHMLYGFSSVAPTVVVSGGAYNSATIKEAYMIDYHRLYISMRWVGEYLNKYSKGFSHTDSVIKYAPSFPEIDILTPMKLAENIIIPDTETNYGRFSKAAESTIKYYEALIDTYGVSSYSLMAASRVHVTLDKGMSVAILKAISEQRTDRKIHIAPSAYVYDPNKEVSEPI